MTGLFHNKYLPFKQFASGQQTSTYHSCSCLQLRQYHRGILAYQIQGIFADGGLDGLQDIIFRQRQRSADDHQLRIEQVNQSCKVTSQFAPDLFHQFNAQDIFFIGGLHNLFQRK